MKMEDAASRTALLVAAYRGRAHARRDGICTDPWAAAIAGDAGLALAQEMDRYFPHMELWFSLRTAYFDDLVRSYAKAVDSTAQVVILGAGFDTRAERLRDIGARFFEVDHPSSQQEKLRRLDALTDYDKDTAVYVSCDFESQDFVQQLVAAGFDVHKPSVVIWEGVSYYLTERAVRATVSRVATGMAADSVLAMDLLSKRMVHGDRVRLSDREVLGMVGRLNEPFRWGSDNVLPLLFEEGFRDIRTLTFDEICLHYTNTYNRENTFFFQKVALASVASRGLRLVS